jgi:hypothetical protein
VRLALQRPQKGEKDGDAEMAGRKWKWHQEIMETEIKGIMRVDVSVKPIEVTGDSNWYATISGITGDALAVAGVGIDYYGVPPTAGPGGPGGPGNPRNPGGPQQPPPGSPGTTPPPTPAPGLPNAQ